MAQLGRQIIVRPRNLSCPIVRRLKVVPTARLTYSNRAKKRIP